jgi:hypothetical protein
LKLLLGFLLGLITLIQLLREHFNSFFQPEGVLNVAGILSLKRCFLFLEFFMIRNSLGFLSLAISPKLLVLSLKGFYLGCLALGFSPKLLQGRLHDLLFSHQLIEL